MASRRLTSTSRRCAGSVSSPRDAAAVEDSGNGIRSAHAAGLRVVAIPNAHFPPDEEALALADVVVDSLDELTPEVIDPDYSE